MAKPNQQVAETVIKAEHRKGGTVSEAHTQPLKKQIMVNREAAWAEIRNDPAYCSMLEEVTTDEEFEKAMLPRNHDISIEDVIPVDEFLDG